MGSDSDQDVFHLICHHNVQNATAAHIHVGPPGNNGPVVFNLGDASSPIDVTGPIPPGGLNVLDAGNLYVNVHSEAFPGGEVRGLIGGCDAAPTTSLCLNDERFRVQAVWSNDGVQDNTALAREIGPDAGLFGFFDRDNVDMLVKVLDGCGSNGHYWVFAAASTDLAYNITVVDTQTQETKSYTNNLGNPAPAVLDTTAFATCP